ncbi:MAG: hypothetical protein WAU42_14795 [Solirubrobacteraceae bacterium]
MLSVYHCGVEGPVFLDDGRVVTSDEPFQLEVKSAHDKALVEEGIIVLVEDPSVTAPEPPAPASTPDAPAAPAADPAPAAADDAPAASEAPDSADTQADAPATSSPSTPKGKGA